ncbi:MAG TPA: TetR/AcrR family transcriptional regulator [Nakamurella sp.]|jgi:AcrR family transcriptional regulator
MVQQDARVTRSRHLITTAVIDLIVDSGLHAVTVDAVVARSGVAKTTLYRHWPSREALLADVLTTALPAQRAPDTGSLEGDLRALARGLAGGLADERTAGLLAAIAFIDGDATLDPIRQAATRSRHTAVREVVERARRRGETIPTDGPDGLIRSIAGPLFYRRFVEGVPPTRTLADRCVTRALSPTDHAAPDPAPLEATP